MTRVQEKICAREFVDGLLEIGFDFFCSVPCSYFGPLLTELENRVDVDYQVASVEAEAIAMAAGATLAGRKALVLIQNSGLGNCVNPITSLLDPFQIPLVILASHRGCQKDAPQHELMGAITYDLMKLLGVRAEAMPNESDKALLVFSQALERGFSENRAQCIILDSKPFSRQTQEPIQNQSCPSRMDAMEAIQKGLTDDVLVVSSTGMMSRDMHNSGDRPQNFYMVGSMGLAGSIGLGIATSQDRPVIVVDGDGSCLMRLGSLTTLGRYQPKNFLHIVLNNGSHSSTGGQPTASSNVDFCRVALGCGYRSARTVDSLLELTSIVEQADILDGPVLVHLRIRSGNENEPRRVQRTLPQVRQDFMAVCR